VPDACQLPDSALNEGGDSLSKGVQVFEPAALHLVEDAFEGDTVRLCPILETLPSRATRRCRAMRTC
jgi:hypothetical protein